ncbi:NAD(P)H-dependent glycerol-3-phosphate dehydrogenase [Macrococcus equipercicus]|uniref:Glycerol-3-phosphate dehydrogenase [NAD(P)+] n=1 Tax=Macrococcus equipercicus TaxID=69967 RepID=A0A9Q9BS24_9STAP|nr:NAD(P)H-dependent glycerol-3-phosphate dehydrogenase [Macrococcus equipercicus]KAA1040179.1 NAD(P)H-dependent glycerol-3-phosphate dehydrogenase [Macrococcus equipercicus]UTH12876.1 NAD(P)H-dependent glycerol-3-phosphate dehydrogenase [Macrococcus equipercicus]
MTAITVLGTGSWGTALANVLLDNGHDVLMWGKTEQTVNELTTDQTNSQYLPGILLNPRMRATTALHEAAAFSDIVIMAVPTKAVREVCRKLNDAVAGRKVFIHVSKGIEPKTFKRISEMIEEEIKPEFFGGVGVLSGPSHAEEVAQKQPTTVVVASCSETIRTMAQDLFMCDYFRVYTNDDLVGVEIGGALKNIIALAVGITDGLGYGDNAKAALMTRGLAEITRLGTKMGADPLTFLGLAGIGDLIVTCTSVHSRNWKCGNMLGRGLSLNDALNEMGMVVEGVRTTEAAYEMARTYHVEMPITEALYGVLFNDEPLENNVKLLMNREKTNE